MPATEKGAPFWESPPIRREPVKIQGVTVKPGEMVIVHRRGQHLMEFNGWAHIPAGAWGNSEPYDGYWMMMERGTGPGMDPGPYRLEELRHPSLLDGIAREIDAAD